jgi:hypothetical protein
VEILQLARSTGVTYIKVSCLSYVKYVVYHPSKHFRGPPTVERETLHIIRSVVAQKIKRRVFIELT